MPHIRAELPGDAAAIHRLHAEAFPTEAEARLVDALRGAGRLFLSLVAVEGAAVAGHVAMSPVVVEGLPGVAGLGLAPLAVALAYRRAGTGSALVREALLRCAGSPFAFVVVLGEPRYYERFRFVPAAAHGLGNEYGAGDEFMVMELKPGFLGSHGGLVKYGPEFAALV